jgi:Protein of unknown function (DUF2934)
MSMELDETMVREQAYLLWEQDGKPDGHDAEYWVRAEALVAEGPVKTPGRRKAAVKAAASKAKAAPSKTAKAGTAAKAKPKKKST